MRLGYFVAEKHDARIKKSSILLNFFKKPNRTTARVTAVLSFLDALASNR